MKRIGSTRRKAPARAPSRTKWLMRSTTGASGRTSAAPMRAWLSMSSRSKRFDLDGWRCAQAAKAATRARSRAAWSPGRAMARATTRSKSPAMRSSTAR